MAFAPQGEGVHGSGNGVGITETSNLYHVPDNGSFAPITQSLIDNLTWYGITAGKWISLETFVARTNRLMIDDRTLRIKTARTDTRITTLII